MSNWLKNVKMTSFKNLILIVRDRVHLSENVLSVAKWCSFAWRHPSYCLITFYPPPSPTCSRSPRQLIKRHACKCMKIWIIPCCLMHSHQKLSTCRYIIRFGRWQRTSKIYNSESKFHFSCRMLIITERLVNVLRGSFSVIGQEWWW